MTRRKTRPKTKPLISLFVLCVALICLCFSGCGRALFRSGEPVTFESMLPALTNRVAMAMPPREGAMRMVSSYDRTGGNSDWMEGLTPDADGLLTLAEVDGPGCVVRIWMTGYRYQDLRFYIDGEREPRIQRAPREFFGGSPPFASPLSGIVSGGSYCYVPIPFARSLVIKGKWPTIGPDNRPYLQVNYFAYPRGTRVESFPRECSPAQWAAAEAVRRRWERPDDARERILLAEAESAEAVTIAPKTSHTWLQEQGAGMLQGFAIKLEFPEETGIVTRTRALRELALQIHWDGQTEPSVAAPLGDFFGNALAWRAWRSLFAGQTNGVFVSQWPMPYTAGARGTLRNDGAQPIRVRTAVVSAPRPDNARYFHAAWHHAVGQGMAYPILNTEGSGHYAGCYLVSMGADGSWNILEGDESFQVDDEPWPSLHGTGLEDYFNGAWYYTGIFDLPIHGLLEKAVMRTTQYRWHPADPVPFSKRLSMQMEFGHGNASRGYMSSVAFWYQDRPRAVRSLRPDPRLKPSDPLEPMVLMPEVFELERIGHWREAAERCALYAARMDRPEITELMALRAAAYATLDGERNAVSRHIEATGQAEHPAVARQAALLAALEQDADRAVLGIQCRGTFKAYLNGVFVGEGTSPNSLAVWLVDLPSGEHELAVEVTPDQRAPFLSLALRWGNHFLRTDDEWEVTDVRPAGWPRTDDPEKEWSDARRMGGEGMLPRMDCWQLDLNAFVNMQSGRQLYYAWDGWDRAPIRTAYFRRRFVKQGD